MVEDAAYHPARSVLMPASISVLLIDEAACEEGLQVAGQKQF